jgi:DNA/RNA endonuclease YhcR with UshA esterase domain
MIGTTAAQMTHRMPACLHLGLACCLATFSGFFAILPSAMAAVRVLVNIPSDQAQEHIGETTTVCGLVASARFVDRERDQPTYLNFDRPYPNQTLAVMIPGSSRDAFTEPPEVLFNGKTVCVTGVIVEYRGKPQIVVEDPAQIVIQEAAPAAASEPSTNISQKTPATISTATNTANPKAPTPPPSAATAKNIPSAQAQQHVGETTTVCGLVASTRYVDRDRDRPTYLNFDQPYPNQTLAVLIPSRSRASFNEPPEVLFKGKTVCVIGLIVEYRGKPQIVVENPSQIVIQK